MKIIKETLVDEKKVIDMSPNRIDLNSITKLINELNFLMAPVVMSDVRKADSLLNEKISEYNQKLLDLKESHAKTKEITNKKKDLMKQLKVLALLSDLHGNYAVNDKIKHDTKILLNELHTFNTKRLDSQIATLKKILK